MTRYTDKTDIEKTWLLELSKSLKKIAAMLDGNVESMAAMELERVSATHLKTAEVAISGLVKFCGAVQAGLAEAAFESMPTEQKRQPGKKAQQNSKPSPDQKRK
jgi:hypothetical protein